jgi:hypothetical protein
VFAIFAVGLALIFVLIAVALYVGGVFNSVGAPSASVPPATASRPTPAPAAPSGTTPTYTVPPSERSTNTFTGQAFTIQYPASWQVATDEAPEDWGTDTTIVSPTESNTSVRVDVSPNSSARSASAFAQPEISQLEKDPGYQQLDLSPEAFNGMEALHWEFRVEQSGITLHKEDLFFRAPNGDGVAVLTQAPDSQYEGQRAQFAALRKSFSMGSA